jgi:hypothetical protein
MKKLKNENIVLDGWYFRGGRGMIIFQVPFGLFS